MNKFDDVFMAIKKHSNMQKRVAELNRFDVIAEEAGVPLHALESYLSHLQRLGLIKYSMEEKYIYLTEFGRKQESLTRR